MSVIATYARLNADSVDALRSNPNWMDALFARKIAGAEVIDIDQACDGIVWILSQLPVPPDEKVEGAGFVLQRSLAPLISGEGGSPERKLDAPYGPASSLSVSQVAKLHSWLQAVDPAKMRSSYNPTAMQNDDVYPEIWEEEGLTAFDEYLLPSFLALRDFIARAHQAGQMVLVFFT